MEEVNLDENGYAVKPDDDDDEDKDEVRFSTPKYIPFDYILTTIKLNPSFCCNRLLVLGIHQLYSRADIDFIQI